MSAEEYNAIWRKIEEHGTTSNGGGDAIAKLIDSCRERIGIRGKGTVARARILMAIDLSGLQDDVTSGVFAPSPSGAVTTVDQSNDNDTEVMPYATVKSNKTPGQGGFKREHKLRLKRLENSRSTQPETATYHVCKKDTAWYCFGCNLYLCNIPPQQKNGGGRSTAKKNGGKMNAKANENGKANVRTTTTTKKKEKKSSAKKAKAKGKGKK
eukprot:scaffold1972_cov82-Skeletonema_dohrnii-CCMP3373.AAC.1